jgi:hypothetical protein
MGRSWPWKKDMHDHRAGSSHAEVTAAVHYCIYTCGINHLLITTATTSMSSWTRRCARIGRQGRWLLGQTSASPRAGTSTRRGSRCHGKGGSQEPAARSEAGLRRRPKLGGIRNVQTMFYMIFKIVFSFCQNVVHINF